MSTFYGSIQGNRGTATRCGSRHSGIRSSAQSWDGSVITNLRYGNDNKLKVRIDLADDSRRVYGETYFTGTMEELKECFKMYQAYKNK